jgi:hypothetical protein
VDEARYTDRHVHPSIQTDVEVVAYETIDGAWDVFVFATLGSCPELEASRTDDEHVFVETIDAADQVDQVAGRIMERLGDAYAIVPYSRESGSRRIIGRITSHLQEANATGVHVQSIGDDYWQLSIRKRDFTAAREVIEPNVGQTD